ncbi:MAG: MFS transporter [Cyclobacteriaceae bacterium]|nr:MFS transporter [Cyclobacteriaceae bacterium]
MNASPNPSRLFIASCLALLVTSLTFAIRAKIEGVFSTDYHLTGEEIGWAFGPAFWGFTLATFAGGLIIDVIKTRRIVWIAFFAHLIGLTVLLFAKDKMMLFLSNLIIGFANGSVEAACNPLVASIYPNQKSRMLNRFHVWFPGGIVIGGLLSWLVMTQLNLSWQVLTSFLFIPLAMYGYLFYGQPIPETERVATGVSYKEMFRQLAAPVTLLILISLMIASASIPGLQLDFNTNLPYILIAVVVTAVIVEGRLINKISLLFPLMVFAMFLTASTELGTNQWINALLEGAGIDPMIILVVVTGIMAVGRYFAGPLIHKLNPPGVLLGSAIAAVGGLYLLSVASGATMTLSAAVVFAVGICYFWPTMLGFVSEYLPKTGALGLSVMGGAGMVATSMVLPIMGKSIDQAGPQQTLTFMTIFPIILVFIFLLVNFIVRKQNANPQ